MKILLILAIMMCAGNTCAKDQIVVQYRIGSVKEEEMDYVKTEKHVHSVTIVYQTVDVEKVSVKLTGKKVLDPLKKFKPIEFGQGELVSPTRLSELITATKLGILELGGNGIQVGKGTYSVLDLLSLYCAANGKKRIVVFYSLGFFFGDVDSNNTLSSPNFCPFGEAYVAISMYPD